jgi:protein Xni
MAIKFLLVDALNLIRRVYAAQPGEDGPERVDGAIASSRHSLQRALKEINPTHAVCVFEGEGSSWRHGIYEDYKAGRAPMPHDLHANLHEFKEAFLEQGVASLAFPGLEADDVIATLAAKVAERNGQVVILSTDKMFLQLLCDRIMVRDHFGQRDLDAFHVKEKFGVRPDQFADFLALAGDNTNNIKGVPGIGTKRASALLADHGSVDRLLSEGKALAGKLGETLSRNEETLRKTQTLVRLRTDLELGLNLK